MKQLGIRWTIGDVSDAGFEALRLSVWGAWHAFGTRSAYGICLNSVPLASAQERTGELPPACEWFDVTHEAPNSLLRYLDCGMAEGAAWKLFPLRLFPDRHELALDNDCILWGIPSAVQRWFDTDGATLLAEDVRACFGVFAPYCGRSPRNAGIRGLPPRFDLERALLKILEPTKQSLRSETDEQGLQVAALTNDTRCEIVNLDDVTICSPFPPHLAHLGSCGAHFCGLNARDLGWQLDDGRRASALVLAHWQRHRPELYARVGVSLPSSPAPNTTTPRWR